LPNICRETGVMDGMKAFRYSSDFSVSARPKFVSIWRTICDHNVGKDVWNKCTCSTAVTF